MTGTKGKEAIVRGDGEIGGKKRVNENKESSLAKRAKVEGEAAGDGTEEEEEEEEKELNNKKVERLSGLLADDPKKLSKKDVEEAINSLNVDDIIRLALKADQGKGRNDDDDDDGVGKWKEGEDWRVKALSAVRSMLCCMEVVPTADIRLVYEKWAPKAFATVLLSALDSYAFRRSNERLKMEYNEIIPKLCGVLPFKLFAHVLEEKRVFTFADEVDAEEMKKGAVERCDYCFGKAEHKGTYGDVCTLMEAVPKGTTVPAGYWIDCRRCGDCDETDYFDGCSVCGCEVGEAVPIPRCLRERKTND